MSSRKLGRVTCDGPTRLSAPFSALFQCPKRGGGRLGEQGEGETGARRWWGKEKVALDGTAGWGVGH